MVLVHRTRWLLKILLVMAYLLIAGCSVINHGNLNMETGQRYQSNGEQIYFTATSQRGDQITYTMNGGMMVGAQPLNRTCANCHGVDGKGEQIRIMMGSYTAPDIRFRSLTSPGDMDHPPYTAETIKQAITQGVDPGGKALAWPMPRWSMSDQDLNDLIVFLKTFK